MFDYVCVVIVKLVLGGIGKSCVIGYVLYVGVNFYDIGDVESFVCC